MSSQHLKDLKAALERSRWRVLEELPGNDTNISAVWCVARPDGSRMFHLEFGGADDVDVLSIERSYSVEVREAPEIGACFARVGRTWPSELDQFISKLEQWAKH